MKYVIIKKISGDNMTIEDEIFKRSNVDFKKLESYGFKKSKDIYEYSKNFLNNNFKACITISKTGEVKGTVYDLETSLEYTNIRTTIEGSFVSKVREEYKKILIDIKEKCFINKYFIFEQSNRITKYIIDKYGDYPEFLWEKYTGTAVFRNKKNNKWYGIIMNIDKSKIDNDTGEVEIIDVKVSEELIEDLTSKKGYYKGYHMNKKSWITMILDDTLKDEEIIKLIDYSYNTVDN